MLRPDARVLMIGGNKGRWHASDPSAPFRHDTGIESWVFALNGSYQGPEPPSLAELANYDLVIANTNLNVLPQFAALATSRPSHTAWVTLIEGSSHNYLELIPGLSETLDASDLVISINKQTTGYFQSLTSSAVRWIGIPYPVDLIASFATPRSQRVDEVFVCPRTSRLPSFTVARQSGLPVRMFVPKVSRKLSNLPLFMRHRNFSRTLEADRVRRLLGGVASRIDLEMEVDEFFAEAGRSRIWVNLDPRATWARFVLDAAALRVPIVTTESTAHGPDLFPETTVPSFHDVRLASEIVHRLIDEPDFEQRVTDRAFAGLDEFRVGPTVARLAASLIEVGRGELVAS